jgi:hypothetical protein
MNGQKEISILESAAIAVAEVAWFIESNGLTQTSKKFVDDAFSFFDKLSDDRIEHRPCTHSKWKELRYRCVSYKKKML